MSITVKEHTKVSPYLLFFLLHASQIGIGALRFQGDIIEGAGKDAWLSILLLGLSLNLIFLMMLYITKHSSQGDIISFHRDTFGKIIGGLLNIIMAVYFVIMGLLVLHSYIDILQIWVFDGIASWEYSLLLCILIYYLVSGGFRIVTGMAFWGVVIPSFLLFSLLYLLYYAEVSYLMPLLSHKPMDYLHSAKEGGSIYFGLETLLVYFPFIKNQAKAKKWGHLGLLYTTYLYLSITIVTFLFFTQGKLQYLSWPTITMIKVITFPFLERFEFIFLFTWLFVILPVITIYLWSATRTLKLTFRKFKPTYILLCLLLGYFIFNTFFIDMYTTKMLGRLVTNIGFLFIYVYIPLLFLISLIKNKLVKRKQEQQGAKPASTDNSSV